MDLVDAVSPAIEDMKKKVAISAGDSGGLTSLQDLSFSGRVFLYHDEPLSNLQKAELTTAYHAKGFDVQFRGLEYLGPAVIAWHQKHHSKPHPVP